MLRSTWAAVTASLLVVIGLGAAAPANGAAGAGGASTNSGVFLLTGTVPNDFGTPVSSYLLTYDARTHRTVQITFPSAANEEGDSNAQISPDGRQVVFERYVSDIEVDTWIVGIDGKGARRLDWLPSTSVIPDPVWAPDGRHLVYQLATIFPDGTASFLLYESDLNGGHQVRLSEPGIDFTFIESNPTFAPGGYRVVTRTDYFDSTRSALFREENDGSHPVQLTSWTLGASGASASPARSGPTKDLLTFLVGNRLATMPATCAGVAVCTRQLRYLTPDQTAYSVSGPVWSPDGKRVAYTSTFGLDNTQVPVPTAVWTMIWNGQDNKPLIQPLSAGPYSVQGWGPRAVQ